MTDKFSSFASNPLTRSNWGETARRTMFCAVVGISLCSAASAQTYEENLAKGAATTEQNFLNVPFVKPENFKTVYTFPGNWPIFENRAPIDRSPQDKPSKVLVASSFGSTTSFP